MQPTSGTELIDTLIDGVRIGDNLVFLGDAAAPLGLVIERFIAATRGRMPLVVVNLADEWEGEVPPGVVVLDWSPALTGQASALPDSIGPGAGFDEALESLAAIDVQVGVGAAFVFDELTAVRDAWGQDAALELFLTACPRLYRRRSLAVWRVRSPDHGQAFVRRLTDVTQVVVELADDRGSLQLFVRKADGREDRIIGRSVHAEVVDGDLLATDTPTSTRARLGTAIRDRRLALGASQVEVARQVGITPSALSQIERGVRGPAGDTLVRLWEVLDVPFGPDPGHDRGYRIARRSGRQRVRLQDGLHGEQLLDDGVSGAVWTLEVTAGASGARAPFSVKLPETILVLAGVLDLQIGGLTETLHEGDAAVLPAATVTGWSNPGRTTTQVLWTVHASR